MSSYKILVYVEVQFFKGVKGKWKNELAASEEKINVEGEYDCSNWI
jgi:hypothetical protein